MKKPNKYHDKLISSFVNINGVLTPTQEAKISVFDRGFLYGDSIYEVIFSESGILIYLNEHIDRLFNSAMILKMNMTISREEIISEIIKTAAASKIENAYIRIIITRGESEINLDPNTSTYNNMVIIVKEKKPHPPQHYSRGIKLTIPQILRNNIKSVNPNAKSGNYLNNVMAISEAKSTGADDAVMKNHQNEITEGTSFNIWVVTNGVLRTPPSSSGILNGITREKIIKLCNENNLAVSFDPFGEETLFKSEEVFISSSTREIMPVSRIDHKDYGDTSKDWPMTVKLSKLLKKDIQREKELGAYKYL